MEFPISPTTSVRRLAVIGGGISGLAAAHRVYRLAPSVRLSLFEAAPRWGGVIHTLHHEGYLLERSADSFLVSDQVPWAKRLAEEVGFADQLIATNREHRRVLVWRQGHAYPVPIGYRLMAPSRLGPVLKSKLLSWRGKARLAWERRIPRRTDGIEESLEQFAVRRVGREAYERLVQPLVAGIYAADPTRLSVAAALPQFLELERQFGSLSRGLARDILPREDSAVPTSSGVRYSQFRTARKGLSSFIEAVVRSLPPDTLRLRTTVQSIQRGAHQTWRLQLKDSTETEEFDAVVIALPALASATLLHDVAPRLSQRLASIPYGGATVAAVGYHRDQIGHPLDAFGLVVPNGERRQVSAISFSSVKFDHRSPDDHVLLRVFVGGPGQEETALLDNQTLQQVIGRELETLLGARGEPALFRVSRWQGHSPLYELGHRGRLQEIEQEMLAVPGIYLAGHAFRGVGIPQCIRSGREAASRAIGI